MDKLPPLNALRCFWAVGKYNSIAKGAEELSVSASAVSQQIKLLESWVGLPLLDRRKSRVELTEKGVLYYEQIGQSFKQIQSATDQLRGTENRSALTISVLPSFASMWLVPRIRSFRDQHPNVDVSIVTTNELVDFNAGDVDLAIRFGAGKYSGLRSQKLMHDYSNVVCSDETQNAYGLKHGVSNSLNNLGNMIFVDAAGSNLTFKLAIRDWLKQNGLNDQEIKYAYQFSDSHLAIDNMLGTKSFMFTRLSLVEQKIQSGEIVAPFGEWLKETASYNLVYPEHIPLRPAAKQFSKWLLEECAGWERDILAKI